MNLHDYFDFLAPNDIRLKGHRIGIEDILYEYIHNAMSPDELATRFPTLTLEEIYATLLYYIRNGSQRDADTSEPLASAYGLYPLLTGCPLGGVLKLLGVHFISVTYTRNQAALDRYLAEWLEDGHQMWLAQQEKPTPVMARLRALRAERLTAKHDSAIEQQAQVAV